MSETTPELYEAALQLISDLTRDLITARRDALEEAVVIAKDHAHIDEKVAGYIAEAIRKAKEKA